MPMLEAVDAKIDSARSELRLLKADIAAFCEERARLIVREDCGEQERWVYRGDAPKAPIQWSVRAGEFAYNLRSALDHLVWQLVSANEDCPGRHSEFPIQSNYNRDNLKSTLRGVSPMVISYIKSVQPYQITERKYPSDSDRVNRGLAMLNDLCNMDKHRHLAIANARWTGEWPKFNILAVFYPQPKHDENSYFDPEHHGSVISRDLRNGETLLITPRFSDWEYLRFPIDAFFEGLAHSNATYGRGISVSEALNACIDSVEMVVSCLRREF